MAKINVLPSEVYNYIAAGEVVERPASVVKELVENSIDAGATFIEIEIVGGGIESIRVTDNGSGIEEEQMATAFLPHATSKIKEAKDLDNIFTLGFRGEALASIAAVSKVEMISKPKKQETAFKIQIEAGKILAKQQCSGKDGTQVKVDDLFFCVPARKKFLKKDKSEEQEVTNLVSRFILAHPEISFTYIADSKTILSSSGSSLKEAMFSVYGKSSIEETLEVNLEKPPYKISGFVGRPSYSKPNRTYQTLIINGRYVINQTVISAVTNAFGEMLMKRKYPFFILNLSLPAESVDVNVHPNKLDVRFENSSRVYTLVFEAVARALSSMDYVSSATDNELDEILKTEMESASSLSDVRITEVKPAPKIDKAGVNLNPFSFNPSNMSEKEKHETKETIMDAMENNAYSGVKDGFGLGSKLLERLANTNNKDTDSSNYTIDKKVSQQNFDLEKTIKKVGKVFNTYLIVEVDDDIFFIDQHAAHERILYEKFKREYDSKQIVIQPLLFPYVLSLNSLESGILSQNIPVMKTLGFDVEEFGKNTFKVNAVPALVSEINFDSFFSEFLSDSKNIAKKSSELIQDYLMQHSCKSAIKGGNDLTDSEINHLYQEMSKEKIALFCPHGRPIAIRLSRSELEKWFKRIV